MLKRMLLVADGLALSFAIFLAFFTVSRFFIVDKFALLFAIALAAAYAFFHIKRSLEKHAEKTLSSADAKAMRNVMINLQLSSKSKVDELITEALSRNGVNVTQKNGILYDADNRKYYVGCFCCDTLEKKDIVQVYNLLQKDEAACFLAETVTDEVRKFADCLGEKITLKTDKDAYSFFKNADALPEDKYSRLFEKTKPKRVFLNKKRAKNYLAFSVFFFIFSFFVPIKIYYVCCGSAMLTLAFASLLFGKD